LGTRKKLPSSPIRPEKIKEALKFIATAELEHATNQAKLFFLFIKRTKLADGLSLNEIAIILRHGNDDLYTDPITGALKPTMESWRQAKQEVLQFRKQMKNHGVILYSVVDPEKGAYYYINISTMELWRIVVSHMDRIIKGMKKQKKDGFDLLGIPRKERNRLSKLKGDQLRRELMKRLAAQLDKRRKKELEEILEQEEEKKQQDTQDKEGDESN
jgi:hypothetical protein